MKNVHMTNNHFRTRNRVKNRTCVKMDFLQLCVIVVFMQWPPVSMKHVSGTISEDICFFHMGLSDFPSKQATVEYSIRYNFTKMKQHCSRKDECYPFLSFHTTDVDSAERDQCYSHMFGQVRNENMRIPLRVYAQYDSYGFTVFTNVQGVVTAKANVKFYDFKERNFSFSLGFQCTTLYLRRNLSLNGIFYDIKLFEQTNNFICYQEVPSKGIFHKCPHFYSHKSEQNLVGSVDGRLSGEKQTMLQVEALKNLTLLNEHQDSCYQHFDELICRLLVPECNLKTNLVTHPCQEMCKDFIDACWKTLERRMPKMVNLFPSVHEKFKIASKYEDLLNCTYLRSTNDSISCFYQPVMCPSPPEVPNAEIHLQRDQYHVKSLVEYSCINDQHQMEGNHTVMCLHSGKWSPTPVCKVSFGFDSPAAVVISVLSVPLAVFCAFIVWCRCKNTKRTYDEVAQLNPREAEFDAFVCYNIDQDNLYVMSELLPELTTNFKIKFAGEFTPGKMVFDSFGKAIKQSNCAIIVMSQGFVNSPMCRHEFDLCKQESIEDSSFKVFVIMMQPDNELKNVNFSIRQFLKTATLLRKEDAGYLDKLWNHLAELRRTHGRPV